MKSALEIHNEILEFSKKYKEKHEVRTVPNGALKVGDVIRQGDIYLEYTSPVDTSSDHVPFKDNQLAPGSTQGSRHMISGDKLVMFKKTNARITEGPVIIAESRFKVTHPEHAHMDLPPGCYNVTYQLDFATMQRVRD